MKYTVEITESGFVETLEAGGKTLRKRWTGDGSRMSCHDRSFADQIADLGIVDEEILEKIYMALDENYAGMDLKKINCRLEARMHMVETP